MNAYSKQESTPSLQENKKINVTIFRKNVQASAGHEHIRNVKQLERWSKFVTADVDFGTEGTMSRSSLPTWGVGGCPELCTIVSKKQNNNKIKDN